MSRGLPAPWSGGTPRPCMHVQSQHTSATTATSTHDLATTITLGRRRHYYRSSGGGGAARRAGSRYYRSIIDQDVRIMSPLHLEIG